MQLFFYILTLSLIFSCNHDIGFESEKNHTSSSSETSLDSNIDLRVSNKKNKQKDTSRNKESIEDANNHFNDFGMCSKT